MKKNKITIEWHFLLKDILKDIWIVILSALIGYMGVYLVAHTTYKPMYTSKAIIAVMGRGQATGSIASFGASADMASVLSNVFCEPTIKEYAVTHLGIDHFDGTVSANILSETNFIEIGVTSNQPQKSYTLLSAVLDIHHKVTSEIFNNATIVILRTPSVPSGPSNRIADDNMSLVVAACVTLSLAIIIIFSLLKDTVKKESDFNEKIDSKLIGTIAHEDKKMTLQELKQKKKKGLLIHSNAYISLRFTENFHKIAAKLEYTKNKNGDKVFAITSVAENEGKSTCAANIAVSLADRGNKVVLVDLDGKKPALYKIFNEDFAEKSELSNLLNKEISMEDFNFRTFKKTSLSLAINTKPNSDYQKWIADGNIDELLNTFKNDFDFVIIDTAPLSLDSAVMDIIQKVDKTIMIVRTNTVTVTALNDFISTISKISSNLAGCILNDVYMNILPFSFTGNDESNYYGYKYGKYSHYSHYGNHKKHHNIKEENEVSELTIAEAYEEKDDSSEKSETDNPTSEAVDKESLKEEAAKKDSENKETTVSEPKEDNSKENIEINS